MAASVRSSWSGTDPLWHHKEAAFSHITAREQCLPVMKLLFACVYVGRCLQGVITLRLTQRAQFKKKKKKDKQKLLHCLSAMRIDGGFIFSPGRKKKKRLSTANFVFSFLLFFLFLQINPKPEKPKLTTSTVSGPSVTDRGAAVSWGASPLTVSSCTCSLSSCLLPSAPASRGRWSDWLPAAAWRGRRKRRANNDTREALRLWRSTRIRTEITAVLNSGGFNYYMYV